MTRLAVRPLRPLRLLVVTLSAATASGIGSFAGASAPPSSEPASVELFDPESSFDPSERIAAVTDDGGVVVISVGEDGTAGDPFPVFDAGDGFVDGVALDADRSTAFVGVCCSPGTIHVATADDGETDSFEGSAPVTSPDRASLAHVLATSIVVTDIVSGETATIDTATTDDGDSDSFTPFDVAWIGNDQLVAFGATDTQVFEFRVYDVAAGSLVTSAPAGDGGQPNFHFAGVDGDGAIVVVDVPLDPTASTSLQRLEPEALTPLQAPDTTTLPVGVMSASLNGAATHVVWVDGDGVLSIDGEPIPGTYRWAAWA